MSEKPLRVLLVDDHEMVLQGLHAMLAHVADAVEIVGTATTSDVARRLAATQSPDIVLSDVRIGRASGIDLVTDLAREQPDIKVVMLTGDNAATAAVIAREAGIEDFRAGILPAGKAAAINALKTAGSVVAMVGDGINDAPALAAADVSFAIGAGSDAAIEAADLTLIRSDLMGVADAISLSAATLGKIRQNLFFAFIYNVVGIPLAALGYLNPVFAGAAMALSSVSVVTSSLMLRRWRPGQ